MWVTRYKVHCGRQKNDWLVWINKCECGSSRCIGDNQFRGCWPKVSASVFITKKQAGGAIKQHRKTWPLERKYCKYTIHEVKVQVKQEKK